MFSFSFTQLVLVLIQKLLSVISRTEDRYLWNHQKIMKTLSSRQEPCEQTNLGRWMLYSLVVHDNKSVKILLFLFFFLFIGTLIKQNSISSPGSTKSKPNTPASFHCIFLWFHLSSVLVPCTCSNTRSWNWNATSSACLLKEKGSAFSQFGTECEKSPRLSFPPGHHADLLSPHQWRCQDLEEPLAW